MPTCVGTEEAREHFTMYVLTVLLYNTFLFLLRLSKYAWLFIYSGTRAKQNVAERKRRKVQAVSLRCRCGQKIQCKNGKNEATKWENAQRLPRSAFDHHRAEIQQLEEEIKANYVVN